MVLELLEKQKTETRPCAVCGKPDQPMRGLNHFQTVCDEHLEYATVFQIDKIREKLGLAEPKVYHCAICEKQLTDAEAEGIQLNHFSVTCNEHRDCDRYVVYDILKKSYQGGRLDECLAAIKTDKWSEFRASMGM